jgi:hypothetical protein
MLSSKRSWLAATCVALAAIFLSSTHAAPATPDAADPAMATISGDAIRADTRFLSDGLLEGRGRV